MAIRLIVVMSEDTLGLGKIIPFLSNRRYLRGFSYCWLSIESLINIVIHK